MSDIYCWQQGIWQQLTQNRQYLGHALLLKGRKGIGKYEFARHLAKSMLCASPTTEQKACDQCLSCRWFEQNGHPNYYSVVPEAFSVSLTENNDQDESEEKSTNPTTKKKNASQQISIEQIRKLNNFVYMTGHQPGCKVILIYPAEAMNHAAANALLKKLEEPPANVLFLLVTHQEQRLLPTIRSRCHQIIMPVPDFETSIAWLKLQAVSDPEVCLALAGYVPITALSIDQGEITVQYQQFIQNISDPKLFDPLALAESLQSINLSLIVSWLQKWCYDLISLSLTGKSRYYVNKLPVARMLSKQINLRSCIAFLRMLNSKQQLSSHPLNARLFLEEIFMDYNLLLKFRK